MYKTFLKQCIVNCKINIEVETVYYQITTTKSSTKPKQRVSIKINETFPIA